MRTRLNRLWAESGEEFPESLTADGGRAGGCTAQELAEALLGIDSAICYDDREYLSAVAAGDRDDNEE